MSGLQCPKYLWLLFNDPSKISEPDASTQYIFDAGHRLGELAKRLFPNGIDIPSADFMGNLNQTRKLLKENRPLFEPAFYVDSVYSRLDILSPIANGIWDIYEVKGSTTVKDENIDDVAFQRHCAIKGGLEIRNCYLVHVNNRYVKNGEIEPEKLFAIEDITDRVQAIAGGVEDKANEMFETIASTSYPDIGVGPHCSEPYDCPVKGCWESLPENNIFDLHRGGKKCFDLLNQGILHISEIPPEIKLSNVQRIQQACEISGIYHVDKPAIQDFLNSLQYPIYYFDFETFNPMIPLYDGTRPYQKIPFQFSVHVVEKEGANPVHHSFLAYGDADPRSELLEALKKGLGERGSIVVYNQTFEKGVLAELGESFPEYSSWVAQIHDRIVDLYIPFRNFSYYHPLQKGSASIKHVLPALTGKSYDGLSIAKGDDASLMFFKMVSGALTTKETMQDRKDLELYCGLDTEGMIWIVEGLDKLCKS